MKMKNTSSFKYPAKFIKQKEGGYLVKFPDFPEAITQGEDRQDAFQQAVDCLEEAIANRIAIKLNIPIPSYAKRNQQLIPLRDILAVKADTGQSH